MMVPAMLVLARKGRRGIVELLNQPPCTGSQDLFEDLHLKVSSLVTVELDRTPKLTDSAVSGPYHQSIADANTVYRKRAFLRLY